MKKLFKWIGIALLVLFVIGLVSGKKEGGGSGGAGPQASAAPKPIHSTTAQALFADYEANEVATDERMKGMLVEVTGTVQSIDKDFTDSIVLALQTSNQFMPARMGLNDAEKPKAIQLSKGAKVVVLCERMSRVVGSPSGRNCSLTAASK